AQSQRLPAQPVTKSHRRGRGSALINLSEVLSLKGYAAEAHKAADEAASLLKPLEDPEKPTAQTPRDRWLLAMALTDRGVAALEEGDRTSARHDLDLAERVVNRILEKNEDDNDARFQLACICNRRGELLGLEAVTLSEAERSYTRAEQGLDKL